MRVHNDSKLQAFSTEDVAQSDDVYGSPRSARPHFPEWESNQCWRAELPETGLKVDLLSIDTLLSRVDLMSSTSRRYLVCGVNLHLLYYLLTDEQVLHVLQASDVVLPDGFPIFLASRASARHHRVARPAGEVAQRIGSTDWLPRIGACQNIKRVSIVGSSQRSNLRAAEELKRRTADNIQVQSLPGENWSEDRAVTVLRDLVEFCPDLVLIGLGMPLQERFISTYWERMPPAVYALVGGAIDQLSGTQRNAPRWLGAIGLEWLWRLLSQPSRLWYRYLVEPWIVLYMLLVRAAQNRFSS
jgi:N-acetylglucosaminyldiphosphoundecaprenol N-acetyl-beta-D-mannosaminyltransferase